jgi:predicted DNA-binding transcriptional regulator YafY
MTNSVINLWYNQTMSTVATRLLSLIFKLQSRPSWKAGELAHELNVSERTIHRYMGMLEDMGIPIYSERGPYGGFSLLRGYKLPPLIFTAEEATVLYMGAQLVRELWGRTYGDAVTAVTAKLDNVLPDDLRQVVERTRQNLVVSGLTQKDYRAWQPTIHTLRHCIAEQRCVRLTYSSFSRQEHTTRVVEPYALVLQWGLWYLVAFCRLRGAMRTFRVDRVQEIHPEDETFSKSADFSVRDYLNRTQKDLLSYTVTVHLGADVASVVKEWQGHWMDITEFEDGSINARFEVADLDWPTGWVLGFGASAKVLEPPELMQRVQATAIAALGRYTNDECGSPAGPNECCQPTIGAG